MRFVINLTSRNLYLKFSIKILLHICFYTMHNFALWKRGSYRKAILLLRIFLYSSTPKYCYHNYNNMKMIKNEHHKTWLLHLLFSLCLAASFENKKSWSDMWNRCFICVTYHETFMSLQTIIKEEDRLASAIAEIDEDVRIVPRAAFIKTPTGQVISNRSFEGQHHAKRQLLAWERDRQTDGQIETEGCGYWEWRGYELMCLSVLLG